MRIVAVSDIHHGVRACDFTVVNSLVRYLKKLGPDVLCFLGDMSPDTSASLKCFCKLLDVPAKKHLFVLGNHDVWLTSRDVKRCHVYGSRHNSGDKKLRLTHCIEELGWKSAEQWGLSHDGVGFIGTMGWYDYSFKDERLGIPIESYRAKEHSGQYWNDGRFVIWGKDDVAVAKECNDGLSDQLVSLKLRKWPLGDDVKVSKIVCLSHFVPFPELQEDKQSFFNAFGGSKTMGDILVNGKVDISLSGHLHRNFETTVNGVECYQTSIGYMDTRMKGDDFEGHVVILDL